MLKSYMLCTSSWDTLAHVEIGHYSSKRIGMLYLDILFNLIHLLIVFFNIIAPFVRPLRKASIFAQSLTIFSWLGLGIYYGIGYCPITDWHWQAKRRLGEYDLPSSYIKYIADYIFSIDSNPWLIDFLTGFIFLSAVSYNFYSYFYRHKKNS